MHQITDRLFVGNIYDAEQPAAEIGALLLVAAEYSIEAPAGLAYDRIPLKEYGEAEIGSLERAVAWIERHLPDNHVMVCCRAGMGRSVSVVMAYLCCVEGLPYADVLKLVKTQRPGALPLPNIQSTIEQVKKLRHSRNI
ncbi:dual specificity protein phosphatase family protein [Petrachloros mirabilis]